MSNFDLFKSRMVYRCLMGSRAYGLNRPDSDLDVRGVFMATTPALLALHAPPEDLEKKDPPREFVAFELSKFLRLGLAGNPSVLEFLWAPQFEQLPVFEPFRANRRAFLSKRIRHSYRGYANGQLQKMESRIKAGEPVRWKNGLHMLRLMRAGTLALLTGEIQVPVEGAFRQQLIAIGHGEVPFETIMAMYKSAETVFDEALETTQLPDSPDEALVGKLLLEARLQDLDNPIRNDWSW